MRKLFYVGLTLLFLFTLIAISGDTAERRGNVHFGNQTRLSFFNYGLAGRRSGVMGDLGLEWPINSGHEYLGDYNLILGTQAKAPDGQHFYSAEVNDSPRGSNEYNPNDPSDFWGWEPLPGYANPISNLVAMSHQPESWPAHWSGWLGIPGDSGIAAQEAFWVMDDATDREFYFANGFLPDSTNPDRYGMGWKVKTHTYQFSDPLLQDVLLFDYNIINEGTSGYPNTFFGLLLGTMIGGNGDTGDDNVGFLPELATVYSWDNDNSGNSGGIVFSPVGYAGFCFLETPGIAYDGIDNDGDGASGSGRILDESVIAATVIQVGDPVVLIDYATYQRTVSLFPADGLSFVFYGDTFSISPGDTLIDLPNGVDDNLNGIIDEMSEIPNNGIDDNENGLVDEFNPHLGRRFADYFSGEGLDNPMIDESKFDGIDNDGDWDAATDDVGLDGVPNTNDMGEGDGMPTSGAGTNQPGEPNIDKTDPGEADQTGVSSLFVFQPFNLVRLWNDEQLFQLGTPGYINYDLQNADSDIFAGCGFFPSLPGDSQKVVIALVMGENLVDMRANVVNVREIYESGFRIEPFAISAMLPEAGEKISGNYPISVNIENGDPGYRIDIWHSEDFGENYHLVAENLANPVEYDWQTTVHPDGVFNKIRIDFEKSGYISSAIESDSIFTINNPGNAIPQLIWVKTPTTESDSVVFSWHGYDADGDSLSVKVESKTPFSPLWRVHADSLKSAGKFAISQYDFYPMQSSFLNEIRLTLSDNSAADTLSANVNVAYHVSQLADSLIVHRRGGANGEMYILIADSVAVNNHVHQVRFEVFNNETYLSVTDVTDSVEIIQNNKLEGCSTVSLYPGMFMYVCNVEAADIDVISEQTKWSDTGVNVPFVARKMQVGSSSGTPYPADYQFIFADEMIDTSLAFTIPGLPDFEATPVNFTIRNILEERRADFVIMNLPPSGNIPERKFIVIIENFPDGQQKPTWSVMYSYPDSINLVLPGAGDEFHLEIRDPFSEKDVYYFSSEAFVVGIDREKPGNKIEQFELFQNYPNPFNPQTTIRFSVPKTEKIKLEIFNLIGQKVAVLVNEQLAPGIYTASFDGKQLASGMYFYRLTAAGFTKTHKMLLVR